MRVWLGMLLLVALAGCGGGDDSTAVDPETRTTSDGVRAQDVGTADPLAITQFSCRQNAKGRWKVKGTLTNSGKTSRDYRVTVFIGQQTGPARMVDLDRVAAGASVPFTLKPIVAAPDGPCRLQALVLH